MNVNNLIHFVQTAIESVVGGIKSGWIGCLHFLQTATNGVPNIAILGGMLTACGVVANHLFGVNWVIRIMDFIQLRRGTRSVGEANLVYAQLFGLYPLDVFAQTDYYEAPYVISLDDMLKPIGLNQQQTTAMRYLRDFLTSSRSDGRSDYLVIINEAGMGKTSLLLKYLITNEHEAKRRRFKIILVRLKSGAAKIDAKLAEVPELDRHRTVVLLDGFDEDPDGQNRHSADRLINLLCLCRGFRKVVITSRPDSYRAVHDDLLEYIRTSSDPRMFARLQPLEVIQLQELAPHQITRILHKRFPRLKYPFRIIANRKRRKIAVQCIKQIKDEAFRPMILEHLYDLTEFADQQISPVVSLDIEDAWDLYTQIVKFWEAREKLRSKEEGKNRIPQSLFDSIHDACWEVALHIYLNRFNTNSEFISTEDLRTILEKLNISVETHNQLLERSLLRRTDDNQYWEFSHRSIGEYVFVCGFIAIDEAYADAGGRRRLVKWTEQMKKFALLRLSKGKINLSKSDLLKCNFSGMSLHESDLSGADIRHANFSDANCKNVEFVEARLDNTLFARTNVEGANFLNATFDQTRFVDVQLEKALNISRQQLVGARTETSNPKKNRAKKILGDLDLAISLGCANTIVVANGEGIILQEPSIIAVMPSKRKMLAFGYEALRVVGRTPATIERQYPFIPGIVSDPEIVQDVLHFLFSQSYGGGRRFCPRVVMPVPMCTTDIQERALRKCLQDAGSGEILIVDSLKCAALGVGLPINNIVGSMIVDVGASGTEIAVISNMSFVHRYRSHICGSMFSEEITNYIRNRRNVMIDNRTAEDIKIKIGSVSPPSALQDETTILVKGRNLSTGLSELIKVDSAEIRTVLSPLAQDIVDLALQIFHKCSEELSGDIEASGIVLSGGASQLNGLLDLFSSNFDVPVRLAPNPITAVAEGAVKFFEASFERYKDRED